jgi:hypothetical protein
LSPNYRQALGATFAMTINDTQSTLSMQIRRGVIEHSKRVHVGHIGSSLSVADLIAVIVGDVLRATSLSDPDRDRFVLPKGHAALALHVALHATGTLTDGDLGGFCANSSPLATRPEHVVASIDFSTGTGVSRLAACIVSVAAADLLAQRDIGASVAVAASVRPALAADLAELTARVPHVVTVEAHCRIGGPASLVREVISQQRLPCRLAVTPSRQCLAELQARPHSSTTFTGSLRRFWPMRLQAPSVAHMVEPPDRVHRKIRDSFVRRAGSLELQSRHDLIDAEFMLACRRESYPVIEISLLTTARMGGRSTTNARSAARMYWCAIGLRVRARGTSGHVTAIPPDVFPAGERGFFIPDHALTQQPSAKSRKAEQ